MQRRHGPRSPYPQEQARNARAIADLVERMLAMPDEDPSGAWEEAMRRLGLAEAQILGAFPTLRATDLVNAWSFVAGHVDEIDRQIRENEGA